MINSKSGKPLLISIIYYPGMPPNAKVSNFFMEFDDYFCSDMSKTKSP